MGKTTIEDLVRQDHEKWSAKFDDLENQAAIFDRGTCIYAARTEPCSVTIKHGIINSQRYVNTDLIYKISPDNPKDGEFTISSKNWKLFATQEDLFDFMRTLFADYETTSTETEDTNGNTTGE